MESRRWGTIARCLGITCLAIAMLAGADSPTAGAIAAAGKATERGAGQLDLLIDGHSFGSLVASVYDHDWKLSGALPAPGTDAAQGFAIPVPGAPATTAFTGTAAFMAQPDGTVAATYAFTCATAGDYRSVNLTIRIPADALVGGGWTADGADGPFAAQAGEPKLFSGTAAAVTLTAGDGRALNVTFPTPANVLIQDDRHWSGSFTLRIGPQGYAAKTGQELVLTARLSAVAAGRRGLGLVPDHEVAITAGPDWIPLQDGLDIVAGSALDLTAAGFQDAPTGVHGRVVADGAHFAFAQRPGIPARFYGVNLCFTAQYLAHDEADRLADRLARLGYNAVRIHHYDGFLVVGDPAHATWNAEHRDQLDYLIAALGRRGIYATTDLYVSRPVSAAELGIAGAAKQGVNFKICVPVMPAAWDDWCAFARGFLDHVNPYTKLRLADDPTLAWVAMINEDNFEDYYGDIARLPAWKQAWNVWLAATYGHDGTATRAGLAAAWGGELKSGEDPAAGSVDLPPDLKTPSPRVRDCLRCLADTETAMFVRMAAFIHGDLRCPALLADESSWFNRPVNQASRTHFDYVDDHFYADHPHFSGRPWQLPLHIDNSDQVVRGFPAARPSAFVRLIDKPFTVTEFNFTAPGQHRGEAGLLTGALAALQDWGGVWRFAYSHSREDVLASARVDYFNLADDPLAQASDRAALFLFLRGDLAPAPTRVAIAMTPADLAAPPANIPQLEPSWSWLAWITGVGTVVVDGQHPLAADVHAIPLGWSAATRTAPDPYDCADDRLLSWAKDDHAVATGNGSDPGRHRYCSEGGAVVIDGGRGSLCIDTANTAAGSAHAGGALAMPRAGVAFSDFTSDASVFASALDGQPLRSSRHILITHLTDLQNSGTCFGDPECRTVLNWGSLPHLVHAGAVTVTLTLADARDFTVWRLATDGRRESPVPAAATATALVFTAQVAGPEGACLLYEVAGPGH